MTIEHRAATPIEGFDGETGLFEAIAVVYDVVDSHGTTFAPGCFTECLESRDIGDVRLTHDFGMEVGRLVDYRDDEEKLVLVGQLDRPERSKRPKLVKSAWRGLKSRTLEEFSIGFLRQIWTGPEGRERFTKAALDHLAIVFEGSVPGTGLLSLRSAAYAGATGGAVYRRMVHALGGLPAATVRNPADADLIAEADEILRRVR